ncbi:hypothetical protein K435DRAFT_813220 [Dendrothele bispora CBS 962.96]|uniref:Uncharacterized protein n=1 Tax=Dendrothele bispora (strain CBS 962.96) TaxID=1314807 RepID=A0A4S8KN17_DENBC|nr:hypothetical protein K435DRAFT_813220 [Dendrothele bispora CBS 962.96]
MKSALPFVLLVSTSITSLPGYALPQVTFTPFGDALEFFTEADDGAVFTGASAIGTAADGSETTFLYNKVDITTTQVSGVTNTITETVEVLHGLGSGWLWLGSTWLESSQQQRHDFVKSQPCQEPALTMESSPWSHEPFCWLGSLQIRLGSSASRSRASHATLIESASGFRMSIEADLSDASASDTAIILGVIGCDSTGEKSGVCSEVQILEDRTTTSTIGQSTQSGSAVPVTVYGALASTSGGDDKNKSAAPSTGIGDTIGMLCIVVVGILSGGLTLL